MASRLLSRSKILTRSLFNLSPSPIDPIISSQYARCLHSLTSVARSQPSDSKPSVSSSPAVASLLASPKNFVFEKTLPRFFSAKAQGGLTSQLFHSAEKEISNKPIKVEHEGIVESDAHPDRNEVVCYSPVEAISIKPRTHLLETEGKKIGRMEKSQHQTYAIIPFLILMSTSSLPTSLLIFSVYWQIYGYVKEILLDYVHQDVTRTWVLVYLKVLLLILVKDTIVDFGLL